MLRNAQLCEQAKLVTGLAPITPSTSTPDYVSLKNHDRAAVVISVQNGTTVTGSAITLHQATDVAATGEKTLPFTGYMRNLDCAASDTLVAGTATGNTFTTNTTNSKQLLYQLDVKAEDLDRANGFDCIRAGTGNAVNTVVSVLYVLFPPRYASPIDRSAITD